MKKLSLIFLFLIVLLSFCTSEEETTQQNNTTGQAAVTQYRVSNQSSFTLYDADSFYYDGVTIFDHILHGPIYGGQNTGSFETTRSEIRVSLRLVPGGTIYLVVDPYSITANTNNDLAITDSTTLTF